MHSTPCDCPGFLERYAAVSCCCLVEQFTEALTSTDWSAQTRSAAERLLEHSDAGSSQTPSATPGLSIGPSMCHGNARLDLVAANGSKFSYIVPWTRTAEALRLVCEARPK